MGSVWIDKVMVFKSSGNAVKAAAMLDTMGYINVMIYDSVVVVSFDSGYVKPDFPDRTMNELIDKSKAILEKYNVDYKFKRMMF